MLIHFIKKSIDKEIREKRKYRVTEILVLSQNFQGY